MANGARLLITHALREMPYAEYLQTEHWRQVRERAFVHHGMRCGVCMKTHGLEIHHIEYDRLGDELMTDVVPLCREHHQLQHDLLRHVIRAAFDGRFGNENKDN